MAVNMIGILASVIDGVLIGSVYGLAAMGLTLIWGVMNVINLAHGAIIVLGMFMLYLIASSLGLYILGFYSFQANVEQTTETLDGIRHLVSMIPAACCILAAIIMAFYPIGLKRSREIEEALKVAHAKEGATA